MGTEISEVNSNSEGCKMSVMHHSNDCDLSYDKCIRNYVRWTVSHEIRKLFRRFSKTFRVRTDVQ